MAAREPRGRHDGAAGPPGAPGPSPWPRAAPHIPQAGRPQKAPPLGRPEPRAAQGRVEGEGRGSARAGGGAAREGRGGAPVAAGLGVSGAWRRGLARALSLSPSLPLGASGGRRACAHAAERRSARHLGVPRLREGCLIAPLFILPPLLRTWTNNRREGTGLLPIEGRVGGTGGGKWGG